MIRDYSEAGGVAKHLQIEISSQDSNVTADDHREPIQGRMLTMSFLSTLKSLSRGKHKEEGDLGEADLNKWFAASGLAYVAICQARETFSPLFTAQVKRPDFLVLLDSIGLIAVDAKNFKTSDWDNACCYTMTLESELKRSIAFERLFRIPLWYAYRNREDNGASWHWISALKAIEVGTERSGQHGSFISIDLAHFALIKHPDDLAKLYIQRLPGVSKIASLGVSAPSA